MIKKIRTSKASKIIAMYLAMMMILEIIAPMTAYALTGGPSQPEFESFTPIETSDMVDLASGDFNYNIPIMDVGGYPINLAYNSTITMDQEASWVGLGWDLNVGQISRQMRGIPDDFDGDEMIYENNIKPNITVGGGVTVFAAVLGAKEESPNLNFGFNANYNNYNGFGFSLSGGMSYEISNNLSVGLSMTASDTDGTTVSPSASLSLKNEGNNNVNIDLGLSAGTALNSRKGIESINGSASFKRTNLCTSKINNAHLSGSLSLNNAASYTPSKRYGMTSNNITFNLNIESEAMGFEPGLKFSGYMTSQGIKKSEKYKVEEAYGFENTYNATDKDILDFNREKDRTFSTNSTTLPITVNTYDLYSIQGQGVSGMFRPYKGQVGYVYDQTINDDSAGGAAGVEFGIGIGSHWGVDLDVNVANSYTKPWRTHNPAVSRFEEQKTGNRPDYEKVFFKNIGGTQVDNDFNVFQDQLGGYDAVRLGITGSKFSRYTELNYKKKNTISGTPIDINITKPIKRNERLKRNQSIQKLTRAEAVRFGFDTQLSAYSQAGKHDKHTSEIRVTKEGGERYIYGRAAYNVTKKEVTFDVSGKTGNCGTGTIVYSPGQDNSAGNSASGDQYFNRITTPSYAHSYLLTSVISSDYSDLTNNGPSDDDLGSYTKFVYNDSKTMSNTYKWRIPFKENTANYDEGLKTSKKDDKANYIYGEKELLYLDTIVTKTHIAIFSLSPRKDGYGVKGENGGISAASKMYKLDKITLYSKPEFKSLGTNATPIKTAYFNYSYSLCKGIDNNLNDQLTANEESNLGGKLTLTKIYFTYGKSNMGKYTPYKFNYTTESNYGYDLKAYDTWGNYKPNPLNVSCAPTSSGITNAEFPFVDQNKDTADKYANAWLLQSVELPSGGKIDVQYESDDYRYVQDKEVMQMFKVVGTGLEANPTAAQLSNNVLYGSPLEGNYLYIKLPKKPDGSTNQEINSSFEKAYVRELVNNPVYFRFLLNMAKPGTYADRYDYVTGYLELNPDYNVFVNPASNGSTSGDPSYYAAISIKRAKKGDGTNPNVLVNAISKAGWNFGRQYLNSLVYTNSADEKTDNLKEIVLNVIKAFPAIFDIMSSPNKQLMDNRIASTFVREKSWIRLMQPEQKKLGGGSRVKEIKMHDQWQVMTNHPDSDAYAQYYGQQYSYNDGNYSSGVATYEPLGNKENPLVQPFYDKKVTSKLLAPDSQNYVEKPLGESFFPSPKITYSKVTVKNLAREAGNKIVKKHATGEVVTEFFTSKDYPTIVDYTDMLSRYDKSNALASILNIRVRDFLTLSQGYSIHTNDMDGKMKSQRVYAEGQTSAISGVDYKYDEVPEGTTATQGKLNNNVITIDAHGVIATKLVGVDYDVINDFRDSGSTTTSAGINANTAVLPLGLILLGIPTFFPAYSKHENQIRMAVTTKVIHTSAILREKVVFDAGSSISTKNLAWDADTGEVLLTQTINEYNDNYYSFNFPAYWSYPGMGQAAKNLGMQWKFKRYDSTPEGTYQFYNTSYKAADYLAEGDELWVKPNVGSEDEFKAYVVNVSNTKFTLITEKGVVVTTAMVSDGDFTVIRSGQRNMQSASMASITSMLNPIYNGNALLSSLPINLFSSQVWSDYKIVNASAIEYKDIWAAQCECNLPKMQYNTTDVNDPNREVTFNYSNDFTNALTAYNPYKYNIKGNWRPKISYAYLTGRNATNQSPRNTGFFNRFDPFYTYDNSTKVKKWVVNILNKSYWQYASEVTQYNPYGFEVENKDALGRYSSAIYGYNFRFPVAVGSNTKYSELAFDGFEDYELSLCDTTSHFSFESNLKNNKVTVSSTQAHSGRKSLKLAPKNKTLIRKQIITCAPASNNP